MCFLWPQRLLFSFIHSCVCFCVSVCICIVHCPAVVMKLGCIQWEYQAVPLIFPNLDSIQKCLNALFGLTGKIQCIYQDTVNKYATTKTYSAKKNTCSTCNVKVFCFFVFVNYHFIFHWYLIKSKLIKLNLLIIHANRQYIISLSSWIFNTFALHLT